MTAKVFLPVLLAVAAVWYFVRRLASRNGERDQEPEEKFCRVCGAFVRPNGDFCPSCGRTL